MAEKIKCSKCGAQATWVYAPHSCHFPPEAHYACDDHVPRNCDFCAWGFIGKDADDPEGLLEGNIASRFTHPQFWKQHLDDQGRQYPCIEWWEDGKGFDISELEDYTRCEYCVYATTN